MSNVKSIYGQIGAAKAYSSSVSRALNSDSDEKKVKELEEKLHEAEEENNDEEQKRLKKKIKRQKKINKMQSKASKTTEKTSDFLAKIASFVDIGIKELIEWIANIVVKVLPGLEVSVKMLLLTNIKKIVSCAINPRIPDYIRNEGILLNEAFIDPRMTLFSSPYSKWGKYLYFGCYEDDEYMEPKSPYSLSRAEDMNAYLWFVKNCAQFITSTTIPIGSMADYFDVEDGYVNFFNTHEFKEKDEGGPRFIEGCTFKHTGVSTIFLCVKKVHKNVNGKNETWYTIVPATDSWVESGSTSSVWYKDRTSLTGLERRKNINYRKSKPLFHLEYIGKHTPSPYYLDGNFMFRILPKPFSVGIGFATDLVNYANKMSDFVDGNIDEYVGDDLKKISNYTYSGIQSLKQTYARFDANGNYDRSGGFSIDTRAYYVIQLPKTNEEGTKDKIFFNIYPYGDNNCVATMELYTPTKEFTLTPVGEIPIQSLITECYFGKTIFEFNYDYVVSMRLFDEKTIAISIIDALMNVNFKSPIDMAREKIASLIKGLFNRNSSDTEIGNDQIIIDSYIDKLIEKIINNEDGEYTDCFYTFSNEDYESMEQEVVNKIANSTLVPNTDDGDNEIEEVYDILNAYKADATLHEKTEVITNAITRATELSGFDCGNVNNNIQQKTRFTDNSDADSSDVESFIKKATKILTSAIVNALLSPKVLMLIQVNRMLMGMDAIPNNLTSKGVKNTLKDNYTIDIAQVLDGLSGMLKDVIKEIINTIQKQLLRLILERIREIMVEYLKKLGIEIAMKWYNILRMLIACFKFNRNKLNASNGNGDEYGAISSIIDQVDYADIDTLIDEIIPQTNPC